MKAPEYILQIWTRINRILFWVAFAAFWILLAGLVRDAMTQGGKETKAAGPRVFELG